MVQQQRFQMRIAIVLAGLMVFVVRTRRRKLFQPLQYVLNQALFQIVHVDGGGNMHRRHEAQPILNAAALDNRFNRWRDVDNFPPQWRLHHQIFRMYMHET